MISVLSLLERVQASPESIALLLAVVIGVGTGLLVVVFRAAIALLEQYLLHDLVLPEARWMYLRLLCVPLLGGALVGGIRAWIPDFGQGLSGLKSVVQNAQEIAIVKPVAKTLAAVISLGTGTSLGPEGPSVEIGANVGSLLGQVLRVSQDRQTLFLAAGAAAGVAGGFDAPIAGVFFAFEVVLGTSFATSAVSVVLLAAVLSSLVVQIGLGGNPAFSLPVYEVRSPLEFPLYLGLGICASLIAWLYTWLNHWTPRLFRGEVENYAWVGQIPIWLQPVLGGAIVGSMALVRPEILGIGYDTIEAVLRDVQFPLVMLLWLLGAKLLAAAVSLGSGLVGGIFAPSLFLGALFGAAYGELLPRFLPWFATAIAAPPAYAMVGMAAVLAAMARAPLTAILLLFEMTRDYRIVLPLMAAVGISVWLFDLLLDPQAHPIETVAAEVVLDDDVDQLQSIRRTLTVDEVMQSDFLQFPESLRLIEVGLSLTQHQQHGGVVVNSSGALVGIVTLRDINRVVSRWKHYQGIVLPMADMLPDGLDTLLPRLPESSLSEWMAVMERTVGEICTRDVLTAFTDESLNEATARMAVRGLHQLPIVERTYPQKVVGMLTREAIELACRLALTRASLQPYLMVAPLQN
jgi:H+/Cl- antiporter ClcA/CBS domain-containing protein